jgi:Subunit 21 of Mediator complex
MATTAVPEDSTTSEAPPPTTTAANVLPVSEISGYANTTDTVVKIDQISALQDGIDSLSLSMFEALRGLRDAVAPESGNLGVSNNQTVGGNNNNNPDNENPMGDFEEFWQSYKNGDPETVALVKKVSSAAPTKREDYIRIHAKVEMEKDAELVTNLATTVLQKSVNIDQRVSNLPGMHRTRTNQMERIQSLLEQNQKATETLEATYQIAVLRREQVRKFVQDNTCEALGIVED